MRELDDTDRELLRLLLADARRPYSELAGEVDLSAPAVSDRIDRLRELGVIRRFTVDLDRGLLQEGVRVLVELSIDPSASEDVRRALAEIDGVEHVFATGDGRVMAAATVPDGDVAGHLAPVLETGAVTEIDATPLVAADWHPGLGSATLGLACAECDNTVTSEGVAAEIGGERYEFCCRSCLDRFRGRYEDLAEGA